MHLLIRVLSYFGRGVCCLVADREFMGQAWLTFCGSSLGQETVAV